MDRIKQQVLQELDRRIARLEEHHKEETTPTDNQYAKLNQALADVIGVPLRKELQSLKTYVETL